MQVQMSRYVLSCVVACSSIAFTATEGVAQVTDRVLVPDSPVVLVNDAPPPPPPPPAPEAMPTRPGEESSGPSTQAPGARNSSSNKTFRTSAVFGELHDIDPYMNNREVVLSGLVGAGGCLAGAVVAGTISAFTSFFVIENRTVEGPDTRGDDAFVRAVSIGLGGAVLACPVAAGASVSAYGDHRGHQGSVWLSIAGGFGGMVAGVIGLVVPFFNYVSIPVMTGTGAMFGYMMSNRKVQNASKLQPGGGAGAPFGFTLRF
jgi:hypothetical protein